MDMINNETGENEMDSKYKLKILLSCIFIMWIVYGNCPASAFAAEVYQVSDLGAVRFVERMNQIQKNYPKLSSGDTYIIFKHVQIGESDTYVVTYGDDDMVQLTVNPQGYVEDIMVYCYHSDATNFSKRVNTVLSALGMSNEERIYISESMRRSPKGVGTAWCSMTERYIGMRVDILRTKSFYGAHILAMR
jgi:hypothetical protein